jgi:hypothetical protein
MKIVKLDKEHIGKIKHLFKFPKFMGVNHSKNYFIGSGEDFSEFYCDSFVSTYVSGLKNYHAYGAEEDTGEINSIIGFYESHEDASWYWTHVRTTGDKPAEIKLILDHIMEYNEGKGRYKFYSMFPLKYQNVYRRLAFSKTNSERYDYFDEFYVGERHQCMFSLPWQILYNRTLLPVDTIVRCTFLKQKYREELFNAGRL